MTHSEKRDESAGRWEFAAIVPVDAIFGLEEEEQELLLVMSLDRNSVVELAEFTTDRDLKVVLPVDPEDVDQWLEALTAYKNCLTGEGDAPQ
ncbi:hypothetical protein SEA_KEELAN_90 [Gordonia phage Keelan]|nr:hypothetical protein SEA_KEELAN_90 [Gordonia phage Keelan]